MRRQLAPFLIFLSVLANVVLGMHLYNRDREINRVTWGYAVNELWKHVSWASTSVTPGPDGRVSANLPGVTLAGDCRRPPPDGVSPPA